MDVRDAIASRYSCRAFLPTPVPEKIVREIVERAARAPSAGNIQPWRVDAIAGERLEALKALMRPRMSELPKGEGTEYADLPGRSAAALQRAPLRGRRDALSLDRRRRARTSRRATNNMRAISNSSARRSACSFRSNAPSCSGNGSISAAIIQNIMLLARDYGLHTCPQEAWASFSRTVSAFLALPDTMMLFCGIALGHADEAAAINSWRAPRVPLADFATFSGFARLIAAYSLLLPAICVESGYASRSCPDFESCPDRSSTLMSACLPAGARWRRRSPSCLSKEQRQAVQASGKVVPLASAKRAVPGPQGRGGQSQALPAARMASSTC